MPAATIAPERPSTPGTSRASTIRRFSPPPSNGIHLKTPPSLVSSPSEKAPASVLSPMTVLKKPTAAAVAISLPKATSSDTEPASAKKQHVNGKWSAEEDAALRAVVHELGGKNWKKISEIAFNCSRTDVQCLHRWQKVLRPGLHKGPWSKEEDVTVLDMVQRCGGVDKVKWSVIAAELPGRLGKQVRERWYNHLDPDLNKTPWSAEEDKKLAHLQSTIGNKWCQIAKMLPGRSENAVKNRWNSAQRRQRQTLKRKLAAETKPKDVGAPKKRRNARVIKKNRNATSVNRGSPSSVEDVGLVVGPHRLQHQTRAANVGAKAAGTVATKSTRQKRKPNASGAVPSSIDSLAAVGDGANSGALDPALQLCMLLNSPSPSDDDTENDFRLPVQLSRKVQKSFSNFPSIQRRPSLSDENVMQACLSIVTLNNDRLI